MISPPKFPRAFPAILAFFLIPSLAAHAASLVSAVTAGTWHSVFIQTDGSLWATGHNAYGQTGDGTTTDRSIPFQITTGVTAAAAGIYHTVYLKTDGTLWTMGWNNKGQLGTGDTTNRKSPVQVATGVKYVTAGKYHTLFLKTDDSLWAMGTNEWKQLGGDDTTNRLLPVMIAADVAEVEAGDYHTMFVKNDRTLWMVGSNGYGQLGNGSRVPQSTPFMLASNVAAISAGEVHSMFTKQDGSLWATGSNAFGQLGDGTEDLRERPVKIVGPASSVSSLSGVILSAGNLSPAFSPGTLVYAVSVPNGTGTLKVTPMVTEPATIAVNGADVGSGAESGAIPLTVGNNMINVVVTAEDEVSSTSYQIVVRREAASSVSTLSKLAIAGATLSPKFNSAISAYTAKVPNATRSLKITATATSGLAVIKVNGLAVKSGSASKAIAMKVAKNTVSVIVTAQNGSTKTYKISVTRAAAVKSSLRPTPVSSQSATGHKWQAKFPA